MANLEKFLRDTDNQEIISMIDDGAEEGRLLYADSGETYKWVAVLRAADVYWGPKDAGISLCRMQEEGLAGDAPQIVVKCRNRYRYWYSPITNLTYKN